MLCHPRLVAVPPATTPSVASTASAPPALTLMRPSGAARMWTSALGRVALAATAVPTWRVAFYAAAPKATSGLGKGERCEWVGRGGTGTGTVARMYTCA